MQLFAEVFNSPYDYKWKAQSSSLWSAFFTTDDGRKITVAMYMFPFDHKGIPTNAKLAYVLFSEESGETETTGKGDAFKIISTVLNIVKEFLNENRNVWAITFSASGKSKISLFQKIIQVIGKKVSPQWVLIRKTKKKRINRDNKLKIYNNFVVIRKDNRDMFYKVRKFFNTNEDET